MAGGLPIKLPYQDVAYDQLVLIKTNIAGYFFDGFASTSYDHSSEITSHPVQQGANVSDHAYVNPVEVTMQILMSDCMSGMVEEQFAGIAYTRSVAAYKILVELQEQRIPFQIHTRLNTFQNMLIKSISIEDDLNTLNGLKASVSLQQILIAKEKYVSISTRGQATDSSSMTVKNAQSVDRSMLLTISNLFTQAYGA